MDITAFLKTTTMDPVKNRGMDRKTSVGGSDDPPHKKQRFRKIFAEKQEVTALLYWHSRQSRDAK
jgi:hypothetical protein